MKIPFIALAMISALLALPASAQQGPAGVPGAPLIGATIAPPPPAPEPPKAQPRKRAPVDCAKAKNVEQCKARPEARKQAREACKGKKGAEHQQCMRDKLPPKK